MLPSDKSTLPLGVPVYKMEYLTTNMDYFTDFFQHITNHRLEVSNKYLNKVKKLSPVDKKQQSNYTAKEVFKGWLPWQQQLFMDVLSKLELEPIYKTLGYNLSFIRTYTLNSNSTKNQPAHINKGPKH